MVGKWRSRFLKAGVDGLYDEPRPGSPRKVSDEQIERIVIHVTWPAHAGVQQQPDPGSNDSGQGRSKLPLITYQHTKTGLSLPFPFFSKRAGTEGSGYAGENQ